VAIVAAADAVKVAIQNVQALQHQAGVAVVRVAVAVNVPIYVLPNAATIVRILAQMPVHLLAGTIAPDQITIRITVLRRMAAIWNVLIPAVMVALQHVAKRVALVAWERVAELVPTIAVKLAAVIAVRNVQAHVKIPQHQAGAAVVPIIAAERRNPADVAVAAVVVPTVA